MMMMMMRMRMEQPSECEGDDGELKLKLQNWGRISRQNAINSRRHSGSYIRSFREEEDEEEEEEEKEEEEEEEKAAASCRSLRTNITISSTASSPGYPLKDEIDPSTYSFTAALRALQARSGWVECGSSSSPEVVCLNSKWNEAEKYICNPLSGQFPLECLSAKTLSNRITMSAPLAYYCSRPQASRIISIPREEATPDHKLIPTLAPAEKKQDGARTTRDAGTQITPPPPAAEPNQVSSGSPSPASTPSILDTGFQRCGAENGDSTPSSYSHSNSKSGHNQVEVKGTVEGTEAKLGKEDRSVKRHGKGGCFSMPWMRKRQPQRQKSSKRNFFLSHLGGF